MIAKHQALQTPTYKEVYIIEDKNIIFFALSEQMLFKIYNATGKDTRKNPWKAEPTHLNQVCSR